MNITNLKSTLFSLLLVLSSSCSEQEEIKQLQPDMKISAYVEQPGETKASMSSFTVNDKLGIYTTYGGLTTPYLGVPANVISFYTGSAWCLEQPIYLTGKPATIYAYYPHAASAGNGITIPVETASQTDYLYGKGDRDINSANPSVNIEMKHALAKIGFKIKKVDYDAKATLKSISITGKDYLFFTGGTLNCETGIVTPAGDNGITAISCDEILTVAFSTVNDLMVIPFSEPTLKDGHVIVTFTIRTDVREEVYSVPIPVSTKWERGISYTYPLTLNGFGLHLNNTDVKITAWGNTLSGTGSTID